MPRYIDADALKDELELADFETDSRMFGGQTVRFEDSVFKIVDSAPTISPDDARGVGKWIRISGYHLDHEYHPARYQCDKCKHFVDSGDDKNYCPNCGAKMEVSEDD